RGALLVAHQHVTDAIAVLQHRVVRRHDRAAGITEHDVDTLGDQRLPDDLGAGEAFHLFLQRVTSEVIAPSDADDTLAAYLRITPRSSGIARGFGVRADRSTPTSIVRVFTSMRMTSPSCTRPIGPPSAASGQTWPTMKPCVAPLKRPSVTSATSS